MSEKQGGHEKSVLEDKEKFGRSKADKKVSQMGDKTSDEVPEGQGEGVEQPSAGKDI